jgi:hypothetical protein
MLTNCQHPQLNTIEKLPRINSFYFFSIHVVPDVTDVEAKLSEVQKA